MNNYLSQMKLDYWYKAVIVISFLLFLFNGLGYLVNYPAVPTALISLGAMFIGLGEWRNHPLQTVVYPNGISEGYPRKFSFIGSVLVVIGVSLCTFGIIKFF